LDLILSHVIESFITILKEAKHWILYCAIGMNSTPSHPIPCYLKLCLAFSFCD